MDCVCTSKCGTSSLTSECVTELVEKFGPKNTFVFELLSAHNYLYRASRKADSSYRQDIEEAIRCFKAAVELRADYPELLGYKNGLFKCVKKEVKRYDKQ